MLCRVTNPENLKKIQGVFASSIIASIVASVPVMLRMPSKSFKTRSRFFFQVSMDSHAESSRFLTVKQRAALGTAVRCAPLAVGSQVHAKAISELVQKGIIICLKHINEQRAVTWFEKTWMVITPMHLPAMPVPTLLRAQRLTGHILGARRSETQ